MRVQQPQLLGKSSTAEQNRHRNYTESGTGLAEFMQWCDDNGIMPPALLLCQWVRTNAPHKSFKNKSLSVMLKDDCVHVKDWTTGETFTFFDDRPPTAIQYQSVREEHERFSRMAEKQQQVDYQKTAQQAAKLWHEATHAPVNGYFASKGLSGTHGARWHERLNCWLVLMTDIEGTIHTVQKIYNKPPPNKFYLQGGRTAGGMVILGSLIPASRVIVTEGFANGCTLREETGESIVCALTASNLLVVCSAIRVAYPAIEIIVASDDDRHSACNIGRLMAIEAAQAVGGKVCYPTFCDGCTACSDFNDAITCNKQQGVTK